MRYALALLVCLSSTTLLSATELEPFGTPYFDEIALQTGFIPDPTEITVLPGGSVSLADAFDNCAGFVGTRPDVRVVYEAGDVFPLIFQTRSDIDTVLLVQAPDGRFFCDDDSAGSLNAEVFFEAPQTGPYNVWVGTYEREGLMQETGATLLVTEMQ